MATSPKCYELYWDGFRPTTNSQVYPCRSRRITQVAAVSAKQALFLAAKGIWYDGTVGIVADHPDAAWDDFGWRLPDGTESKARPYKHGRVVKPKC